LEKVLVVGERSFVGKSLKNYDRVSYHQLDDVDLTQYDVVVNCALHPAYKLEKYKQRYDIDFKVSQKATKANCHYVMISTRKVYGAGGTDSVEIFDEFSDINPSSYYGENKSITELKLLSNFPDKVTILRASNIFGYEFGRNSFTGYCMTQLVNEGRINFTIVQTVKRDFINVNAVSKILEEVCKKRPLGVYNLSSGYGLEVGKAAQWLIDGYGYDAEIHNLDYKNEEQFVLANNKLKKELNIDIGPFDYEKEFYYLGKELCKI
jgi:nucleoside-diphosphate-sugar epimerase